MLCQLNAGKNTGCKYVRGVFWAWCHGYIVALTSNVFATSFNDFYPHIPAFGENFFFFCANYWQHWWLHANGGRLALASETRSLRPGCILRLQLGETQWRLPKREASEALLRWKLGRGPGSLKACCCDLWPAGESVWLVEQRAAVVTKPGARQSCLVKNK